ncbi:MAG: GIY-YIG nuclease family protein [Bacteroidota bacterium]
MLRHNKGYVRSTRRKIPFDLGYFEVYSTRTEAMWREWELKTKVNTTEKKKLVDGFEKNMIKSILSE